MRLRLLRKLSPLLFSSLGLLEPFLQAHPKGFLRYSSPLLNELRACQRLAVLEAFFKGIPRVARKRDSGHDCVRDPSTKNHAYSGTEMGQKADKNVTRERDISTPVVRFSVNETLEQRVQRLLGKREATPFEWFWWGWRHHRRVTAVMFW